MQKLFPIDLIIALYNVALVLILLIPKCRKERFKLESANDLVSTSH